MQVKEIAKAPVITAHSNETIEVIARRMRDHHVGTVVIVQPQTKGDTPIGIITDRDIVLIVVSQGLDPELTVAKEVMSDDLITAHEDSDVLNVMEIMRQNGVRRIPVIDRFHFLRGIVTMDDLLGLNGSERLRLVPHQQINWEKAAK